LSFDGGELRKKVARQEDYFKGFSIEGEMDAGSIGEGEENPFSKDACISTQNCNYRQS
jgi:hypothetical protein